MNPQFDVAGVGAGLGGATAALVAARQGCRVLLVERGQRPGCKNVIGGVLYATALEGLFPGLGDVAPVERPVTFRSFGMMTEDAHAGFEVRSAAFGEPPTYNQSFTLRRSAFDPWLTARATEAGVTLVTGTVVEALRHEQDDPARPVIGIRCGREGGDVDARVVILAEGAHALLAEQEGLRPRTTGAQVMLGVKALLSLDRARIADRFHLEGRQGRAMEFFGFPARGGFGSGFVYTNLDSLSVGVTVAVSHLARGRHRPLDLLNAFVAHPSIRPLVADARPEEYCAHLLPVGSAAEMPRRVADGLLLVGDAARLANMSHYKEITNLVTASAIAAGETAAEAVKDGDVSARTLAGYERRLRAGFVLPDLEKFSGLADLLEGSPELLELYPRLLCDLMVRHFTVSDLPKAKAERELLRSVTRQVRPRALRRDLVRVLEAMGFSLVPLLRQVAAPALRPGLHWLRFLWPFGRRRGR